MKNKIINTFEPEAIETLERALLEGKEVRCTNNARLSQTRATFKCYNDKWAVAVEPVDGSYYDFSLLLTKDMLSDAEKNMVKKLINRKGYDEGLIAFNKTFTDEIIQYDMDELIK